MNYIREVGGQPSEPIGMREPCDTASRRCGRMSSHASPPDPARPDAPDGLLDKVRKLLAMAEGSDNPNEADAFSRKAAELIAAHRIDPERLRRGDRHDDLEVREYELGRGAYVRGRLALLQAVAEAHGGRVVFEARQRGTVAYVAGFRADLDAIEVLHHSLHTQVSARMAAERRSTAAATQRWRRSFLFGYADQIRRMLDDTTRAARQQVHPSSAAVPALRARERRVDEFARQRFGRVVAARRPKAATVTGWEAGARAARQADIGRDRVAGVRAIGRGA